MVDKMSKPSFARLYVCSTVGGRMKSYLASVRVNTGVSHAVTCKKQEAHGPLRSAEIDAVSCAELLFVECAYHLISPL